MSFFFNKQQEEKTINIDYPNLLSSCLLIADYNKKYSIGIYRYMISISYIGTKEFIKWICSNWLSFKNVKKSAHISTSL